jgi:hypothetical protein
MQIMNLRQSAILALDSLDLESHCSEAEHFNENSHTADPERRQPIKKLPAKIHAVWFRRTV